jgi:hypothetical protein
MKTKGMYQRWIGALAGLLILALGGCADPFMPGKRDPAGETIPPGMGLARISLALGGERTAVPNIGDYYFTLKFTATGKADVNTTLDSASVSTVAEVALEPATWNLEVNGYTKSNNTYPELSENISVPITAGTASIFSVYLSPNPRSGELGSLKYTINLSALNALNGIRAWFGLYPLEIFGTGGLSEISREIDISDSAGSIPSESDPIVLPEGTYRAVIDLYDSANNKAAVRTEVVHIYGNRDTPFDRTFTAADFAACPPVVGKGATTLAAKLDAALASVDAEVCTIVLDGTETDLASFEPRSLNITGDRTFIIRGNGEVVRLNTTEESFSLEATTIYLSLTLELRDITLRGSEDSASVVRVGRGGTLVMKTGSRITGNFSSYYSYGGGVHVSNNGTFSMSGGKVSGNTSSHGGGVYVSNYGTFSMSGGAVSGNTSSHGGGVCVVDHGTFNMSGGAVSGNTANTANTTEGGGVYVSNNGTFNMSGGAVSGNTSSYGAVYVSDYGTFSMSGGATVSGNMFKSPGSTYGREVLVFYNGTFNLSGEAMPERVFLYDNSRYITISGPLSGGVIPIDLGGTDVFIPLYLLASYEDTQILRLDSAAYSGGDLAELKDHFSLGEAKQTDTSNAGIAITGYKIDDDGFFVADSAP